MNKQKELDKLAEKLGIGKDREVECIKCHKKINNKNAYILKKNDDVYYLCNECFDIITITPKLTEEVKRITIEEIEKFIKDNQNKPNTTPYQPLGTIKWTGGYTTIDNKYAITSNNDMSTMLFEPYK